MLRLLATLAAISLVLAVTACGGSKSGAGSGSTTAAATTVAKPTGPPLSKAAYQAKLKSISKDIGSKLQSAGGGSKEATPQDLAAAKKALGEFADELEKINPPADVAQAHALLVQAMRQFANDIEGIFASVKKAKNAQDAIAALFGAPAVQQLIKVQQQFKAKGYTLNLGG